MRTLNQTAREHDVHHDNPADTILKLHRLISQLISEVESLDHAFLPNSEAFLSDHIGDICFYDEVKRFEIALISAALRKSGGNQLYAAQLLNLNPTTLNAKIKQYELRHIGVLMRS